MYSILIPTYNFVCYNLVAALYRQAECLALPFEILVADDGSEEDVKKENRFINDFPNCRYMELQENVGRAKIRNILARTAQYEYLIFMDSDAMVHDPVFIENYIKACHEAPVICGGILHLYQYSNEHNRLRYRYERDAAVRFTSEKRNKRPYQAFRTFNFMVRRDVMLAFPFDERMVRYGHEDTLFGKLLQAENIPVLHIENPLVNTDIEPNDVFLKKTEEALESLSDHADELSGYSSLLTLRDYLDCMHIRWFVSKVHRALSPLLRRNLLGSRPSVFLYGVYKVGYFCSCKA